METGFSGKSFTMLGLLTPRQAEKLQSSSVLSVSCG